MPRSASHAQQSTSGTARSSRRRANAPKTRSRNGCSECKIRRLKCDETKPACLACIKSSRPCPGYRKAFRWSTKHEASLVARDEGGGELPCAEVNTALDVLGRTESHNELHRRVSDAAHDGVAFSTLNGLAVDEPELKTPRRTSTGDMNDESSAFDSFLAEDQDEEINRATGSMWDISDDDNMPLLQSTIDEEVCLPAPEADFMVIPFSDGSLGPTAAPDSVTQLPGVISRGLIDYSTLLVEEWFKNVCPMFSSFDSDVNLHRKLARESWTRCMAMNSSLQSMAAICLAPQMPFMRRVAASHLNNAICAIEADLQLVRNSDTLQLQTDLLFALCCVGTTACWVNTHDTVTHYLHEAKTLFRRALQVRNGYSPSETQQLHFFQDCLVYWNMLVSVVSEDSDDSDLAASIETDTLPVRREQSLIIPHPWAGASATAQALLGRAIRLCRLFRLRFKRNMKLTALNLEAALQEIRQAQRIEEELLSLELPSIDKIMETGDKLSPRSHFYHVAEAYRLASLLQLYQTFPDLVTRRLPGQATDVTGCVPWDKWIVPLCLRLVEVLRQIPVSSGTRCIQPLLYITASTGLRFNQDILAQSRESGPNPSLSDTFALANEPGRTESMQSFFDIDDTLATASITPLSLEITHARQFILGRLGMLEHSLPPAPIRVAQDLVKVIWEVYDSDMSSSKNTHWIDIMEKSNFRTLFG